MYRIDLGHPCKVYFIGIGGISMSGLAEILMSKGFTVAGSDRQVSEMTKRLESQGACIFYDQVAENIANQDMDVVVYTAAIHEDHPELKEARDRNLPVLTRAELLGQIMQFYPTAVAIAGTHGKTTTTSMLTEIYMAAGEDPTVTVGGMLDSIGGNFHLGESDNFITEACEYTNSFLDFYPSVEAILNIEADHLDFFKDLDDIRSSFRKFMQKLKVNDTLVINQSIQNLEELTKDIPADIVTFGLAGSQSDYTAENITYDGMACAVFELVYHQEKIISVHLAVPGEHNVLNALAASAVALEKKIAPEFIKKGLEAFHGTHRRFEKKGVLNGVTIIDDYAHHPQEIEATLVAAKVCEHNKVWCIFQPHTYTRTKALLDDFAVALAKADEIILADIYAARETDTLGISSQTLADKIAEQGASVRYLESFDKIKQYALEHCEKGDILITMGAGDVVKIGEDLLANK
jgi:UDP-N-acetylmuramate--alanine ligase